MPSGDAHRSLARALDILELCSQNGVGYTLTQLSQQLGIAKGSISPLLHTLQDRGYLTLDEQDHHYRIGRMAFRIGNTYLDEASALREIHRLMKDIVAACHETCHLGCLKNGDVYYLKKVESPLYSHTVTVEGRSLPAYATGVGKALLADYQLPQLKALYYDGLYLLRSTPSPTFGNWPTSWWRSRPRALPTSARRAPGASGASACPCGRTAEWLPPSA